MQVKYDSINVGENQLAKITRRKLLCFPFGQTDRNDINMFYSLHSHGRMRRVTVLHELVLGKFISNKWNEHRRKNIA